MEEYISTLFFTLVASTQGFSCFLVYMDYVPTFAQSFHPLHMYHETASSYLRGFFLARRRRNTLSLPKEIRPNVYYLSPKEIHIIRHRRVPPTLFLLLLSIFYTAAQPRIRSCHPVPLAFVTTAEAVVHEVVSTASVFSLDRATEGTSRFKVSPQAGMMTMMRKIALAISHTTLGSIRHTDKHCSWPTFQSHPAPLSEFDYPSIAPHVDGQSRSLPPLQHPTSTLSIMLVIKATSLTIDPPRRAPLLTRIHTLKLADQVSHESFVPIT